MQIKFKYTNTISLYLSLFCLLYIRYFENNLWYTNQTDFFLYLYLYIAIPLFYVSLAIPPSLSIYKISKFEIPTRLRKILFYSLLVITILYIALILLKGLRYINFNFPIRFFSIYSFLFFALGALFSLTRT